MAEPEPAPVPARDEQPDRRIRATVFWVLAAVTCLAISAAHYLQRVFSYPLSTADPASGDPVPGTVRHGSFGAWLAELRGDPPDDGRQPIVLLGNSVYQACSIAERMQRLANGSGERVRFFNLAQTGAGIHDHFAHMLKSLAIAPKLLVVTFVNVAFTPGYAGTMLPRFRTDSDQMLCDGGAILAAPFSFLRRELTIATAADSLVASIFPFKRLDLILRYEVDRWLYWQLVERFGVDPVALRIFFPLPQLNLTQDWIDRRAAAPLPGTALRPYPESRALVTEFLTVCALRDIPVLFLHMESGDAYPPDVLPDVEQACAAFPMARVVDLKSAFRAEDFIDQVHPAEHARDAYARRHYGVIMRAFRDLNRTAQRGGEKR
jgi:hypothetical protein